MGKKKEEICCDVAILIALMKEQPLTKKELIEKSGFSKSQFYRRIPLLTDRAIVKEIDGKYVINVGGYKNAYVELDNILRKLTRKYVIRTVSLNDLANLVGKSPKEIEDAAYRLAEKYHIKIGPKTEPPIGMRSLIKAYGEKSKTPNLENDEIF